MPKRDRTQYMREYCARKRQSAEPEAAGPGPEAGGVPAVPERYAATLRFLAGAPMAAADLLRLLVGATLMTLAKDCGRIFFRRPQLAHDRTAAPDSPGSA